MLQTITAAFDGKAEVAGIGELGVFGLGVDVIIQLKLAGGKHRHVPGPGVMQEDLPGLGHRSLARERRQGRLRRLPERMGGRQRQHQKEFECPIRGAGGVVILRHDKVRVVIPDGQDAIAVKDRLRQPVTQMTHDEPFSSGPA